MHRSRLAGFIIDCQGADPKQAAEFWSQALGMAPRGPEADGYVPLDGSARDLAVEVQTVTHPSRVHLDIESDDVEAEVKRLEQLGARRIEQIRTWWVLEAPTGQRFCVIRAKTDLATRPDGHLWK
jgi:glyoxalase superfamily protein